LLASPPPPAQELLVKMIQVGNDLLMSGGSLNLTALSGLDTDFSPGPLMSSHARSPCPCRERLQPLAGVAV
jgi:hypothetical protein